MKYSLKDIPDIEVLRQQQLWWENKDLPFTYEVLGKKYGSEKLVCKKMEKLASGRDNLLEYGVSLRTAWLTDRAKELLNKTNS